MIVEDLVKLSMQEMQVIAAGVSPTKEEEDIGIKRLNSLITSLQNDMVFLTYQDVAEITTLDGVSDYPTKIDTYRVRGFDDTRVNILSRKDFDQYRHGGTGRIDVFIEYNYNPPLVRFTEPQEADTKYKYRRDVMALDILSGQNIPFRKNAIELLILGLAYKLCPAYGVEVSRRDSIKVDYMEELNKYRQAQTSRIGDEIVAPIAVAVV